MGWRLPTSSERRQVRALLRERGALLGCSAGPLSERKGGGGADRRGGGKGTGRPERSLDHAGGQIVN